MRTTLDLDDDVLASAKELARRENKTAGQVLSELARAGLTHGRSGGAAAASTPPPAAFGFVPFATRGGVVTSELVRELRDRSDE